jgi:hypothetical protein
VIARHAISDGEKDMTVMREVANRVPVTILVCSPAPLLGRLAIAAEDGDAPGLGSVKIQPASTIIT